MKRQSALDIGIAALEETHRRIRSLLTRGDIALEDEKTTTIWLMSVYYAVRSLKAKRRRENRSWPSMK